MAMNLGYFPSAQLNPHAQIEHILLCIEALWGDGFGEITESQRLWERK
jgi:hypothetical protein